MGWASILGRGVETARPPAPELVADLAGLTTREENDFEHDTPGCRRAMMARGI